MAVIAVSLLIVVHEFGHLIAAKAVGMRVEVFAIGFWKKLIGVRVGETEYRICLIPLGGYVKVSGDDSAPGKAEPHEFWSKTPGQRALFVLGGVTMNLVLAVGLFIVAFAIGVPFTVGEVGRVLPGEPAWQAGLQAGDRIVAVDGMQNPTFEDLIRRVALGGKDQLYLHVERDGSLMDFAVAPRYHSGAGMRMIGVEPPVEPVVTKLTDVDGQEDAGPAVEAGMRPGDVVLAIAGRPVATAFELDTELADFEPGDEVELLIEREGQPLTVRPRMVASPQKGLGISGLTAVVEAVAAGGEAEQAGLRAGDRITALNGVPVGSGIDLELVAREQLGEMALTVERDGGEVTVALTLPDRVSLARFRRSVLFETGPEMTWVREGSPAWEAGLRPGDVIVGIGKKEVSAWSDIGRALAGGGDDPRVVRWLRDGQIVAAEMLPVEDPTLAVGHPGFLCERPKTVLQRYGVLAAVQKGVVNTWQTLAEIVLMVRGFATRSVSTEQMGGIVSIAVVSYRAAQQGLGKLLYLTAVISGSLAFLNILPIPVLDGGHLLFILMEKLRGRRLGERALLLSNAVGLALLLMLVVYVTWNDIARLVGL